MNDSNRKLVQASVKEAGLFLEGKLPGDGRNSYAHLWERIKHHMGKSYKECDDEQLDEVLAIIAHYRNNV